MNGINKFVFETCVRGDSCCKRWREEYRATCFEGQTTTDTDVDVVSCVDSV